MDYCVAIPIFNEEKNIKNLFRAISRSHLVKDKFCKKIILVDDGSIDNSRTIMIKNDLKLKKLIVLFHKKNLGYGAALKTAIKYAKKKSKYIIFMDSDLTNPIVDIKKTFKYMRRNVDFIQSNRYHKSIKEIQLKRKLVGIIGNYLSRFFINMYLNDYTSGFRAVKLNLYSKVKLNESDFSIIMEEKYKIKKHIKTISEFPTKLTERNKNIGQSAFNYSFSLVSKYLYYCVNSFFINNKNLKKIN